MLRLGWLSGPVHHETAPVLISVTDFKVSSVRHVLGVYLAGLRLRRAWPELDGAVGLWLWAKPLRLRSGAVSVWRSEEDLRGFVQWPVHVEIMRKFRNVGTITTDSWEATRFVPRAAWRDAKQWLDGKGPQP